MESSRPTEDKNAVRQSKLPFLHPKVNAKDFKDNNLLTPFQIAAIKAWFKNNPKSNISPENLKLKVNGKSITIPYPVARSKDETGKEYYFAIYQKKC